MTPPLTELYKESLAFTKDKECSLCVVGDNFHFFMKETYILPNSLL